MSSTGFIIYDNDMLEAQILDLNADTEPISVLERAFVALKKGRNVVLALDMVETYRQLQEATSIQAFLAQVEQEAEIVALK